MTSSVRWWLKVLALSSLLIAKANKDGTHRDSIAAVKDSTNRHDLNHEGAGLKPFTVHKRQRKTEPLEVQAHPPSGHGVDSSSITVLKSKDEEHNDEDPGLATGEPSGRSPQEVENKSPEGDDQAGKPPYPLSRWCQKDKLLLSTGELTVLNLSALFILSLLTIWHLGYLFLSRCKPSGYDTLDEARPTVSMEQEEESNIEQDGYSCTTPGKYMIRVMILYTVICQIAVGALICNELCIPLVGGIDYWDMRAKPFFISWVIGFFSLLSCFIIRNTHIGNSMFYVKQPLSSCEQVLITDYSRTVNPGEQDILRSSAEWLSNLATFLKLNLNIPDSIFKVTFDKYKNTASWAYVPVVNKEGERFFHYQCVKFTYNDELGLFVDSSRKVANYLRNTNLTDLLDKGGLTEAESFRRTCDVGKNIIAVKSVSFWMLLYREVSDPVFILQLYLTMKSIYWKSIITAPIWGFMVIYTILKKVKIINDQQKDLHQLATSSSNNMVTVLREHVTKSVPASDLAIGDIVRVDSNWEVPSDMVMLRGDVIVDESSISGESVPLRKSKLNVDKGGYSLSIFDLNLSMKGAGKKASQNKGVTDHLLKAGTHIISVVGNEEIAASAVAVVIATGVYTTRGKQMKGVLFPNQFRLKYDTQLPMMFILTSIYAIVCSSYQVQFLGWNMTSIFYSLGTLSQVAPVWASTMISIGQSRACERLSESESICCIAPSRIPIFGKLRVMCFDKTGTLTNNTLVFEGLKMISGSTKETITVYPEEVLQQISCIKTAPQMANKKEDATMKQIFCLAMATCHSLFPRDGDDQQLGNQVDKSMFSATGCTVEQFIDSDGNTRRYIRSPTNRGLILEILKTFDFHYQKKLSSIVVSVKTAPSDKPVLIAFVKGAYESVSTCSKGNLSEIAALATRESAAGSYVLGLGYKFISDISNITRRESVESNLTMGGLLIFNNCVREDSASVISSLHEAKVRPVILTGDNIPTSQFVAKTVGMFGDYGVGGPHAELIDGNLVWHFPESPTDEENLYFGVQCDNLAITGDAFDYLEKDWENILRAHDRFTTNETANDSLFEQFLLRVRIFARLNPHQKVRIINSFKKLGIITGMCGDGTNDCLALQASHAGISLTNGNASMVAPFTSKNNKLQSVITLIREGRGSLVTSLACFKFMLLFGLMIAFVKVCLFKKCRGVMPEWGYLLLENAILLSLSHTMALSRPNEKLRIRSPTSSLLGPLSLSSVGLMFGTNVIFLMLLFKLYDYVGIPNSLEFNRKANPASWWILSDNFEAPTVCLWLCYQVVNAGLVFSFGGIFRESVLRNTYFTLTWLGINSVLTYLLFSGPSRITCLFRINCTDAVSRQTVFPVLRFLTTSANGNPFYGQEGHNVMPMKLKILFLALNVANALVNGLISRYLLGSEFLKALGSIIGHKCSADRIKLFTLAHIAYIFYSYVNPFLLPRTFPKRSLLISSSSGSLGIGDRASENGFDYMQLGTITTSNLADMGITVPRKIQRDAFDVICDPGSSNLLLSAETGCGKTLAYMLPILRLMTSQQHLIAHPSTVIMVPNHILTNQVMLVLSKLFSGTGITVETVDNIETQEMPYVVIGTPLKLLTKFKVYNLNFKVNVFQNIKFLVLDEADQIVEETHEKSLREFLKLANRRSKTVLSAATVSTAGKLSTENTIRRLFKRIKTIKSDTLHSLPSNIDSEFVYCVDYRQKVQTVLDVLQQVGPDERAFIFCGSVESTVLLAHELKTRNPRLDIGLVNRDIDLQGQIKALDTINGNQFIVCTDNIARGIDIGTVKLVVQFDYPTSVLHYLHRAGRAGRNMRKCKTVLLWTDENKEFHHLLYENCNNLDVLFSRKRGLRKKLKRASAIVPGDGSAQVVESDRIISQ